MYSDAHARSINQFPDGYGLDQLNQDFRDVYGVAGSVGVCLVLAGLADGRQDFGADPTLEGDSARLAGSKDEFIKAGFGDEKGLATALFDRVI